MDLAGSITPMPTATAFPSIELHPHGSLLSLWSSPADALFFDAAGRLMSAYRRGWFITRGLSGVCIARRWNGKQREIRTLSQKETGALIHFSRALARETMARPVSRAGDPSVDAEKVSRWLDRARMFDYTADGQAFRRIYGGVGILPPDHYTACVVQLTRGCRWNRCSFCTFYHDEPYALRDLTGVRQHLEELRDFFGDGLSARTAVFLSEANALGASMELLEMTLQLISKELAPRMPGFRGVFSFIEPGESQHLGTPELQRLRELGLRRIYYGLETGNAALRRALGKPGTLETVERSVRQAKEAGLLAGLVVLVGAGGSDGSRSHVLDTVRFLKSLPLSDHDIVFLSPLHQPCGPPAIDASGFDGAEEADVFRMMLHGPVRVAPYDIREFAY